MLAGLERVLPHIAGGPELAAKLTPDMRKKLLAAMAGLKERAKTLVELADGARFIVAERPLVLDNNAAGLPTAEARNLLRDLLADLKTREPWTAGTTEQPLRAFSDRHGVKHLTL